MKSYFKKLFLAGLKIPTFFASFFDKYYLTDNVPMSKTVSHTKWRGYLYENFNKPGIRVLEVGSREVTGSSNARENFSKASYVGFDYYDGNNVDVVGDAHKLSSYFKEEEKFDLIYSSACFEHFAMPWMAAEEMVKLLKVGGTVFVETHFSFISHERPWNFFQFSDMALRTLFSPAIGMGVYRGGIFYSYCWAFFCLSLPHTSKKDPLPGLYCHVEYLGKKVKDIEDFNWNNVDLDDVVGNTKYPPPRKELEHLTKLG